ncbi:MAG: SGNH/GDSL hydrolase family protein, partial [Elusimicrobia bacterium]|nr:SGNH/GDSL hydrolase family protein [Elusimicrobiota bacterium]
MSARRARGGAPGWALAAGGLLFALVLAESVLRLTGLRLPEFWRSDPVVGLSLRPGTAGWFVDEGRAPVRINSDGFRDRERTREKPAGTFRALVLGDSFTEAVQVPLEDTFEQRAERALAACPALKGRPVEVLNWGVRGYGTVEELELLKLRAESFSPDVVVLAHYPETDLLDNARAWARPDAAPLIAEKGGRLEFTPAVDAARVRYEAALREDHSEDFPRNLRLVELAEAAVTHWRHRAFWRTGRGNDPGRADYPAGGVYGPPRDEAWRRAWALQEGLLDLLARETAARGARVLLLLVSSPVQVFPEPAERAIER